jgi:hypothetical protein
VPDTPLSMSVQVTIESPPLPAGPKVARMAVCDHIGNRYNTRRVTFQDANQVSQVSQVDQLPSPSTIAARAEAACEPACSKRWP